ncbi:MAG TPA: SAM-dependent methyltransferase [Pseudonocardiaceae bacterium]
MSIVDDSTGQPIVAMDQVSAQRILEKSTGHPHEGRIYDYLLGGSSNFAVDRAFARQQIKQYPAMSWVAQQNRHCLGRFVRYMLHHGIRQFVDIGSGLPTQGNVHQIADQVAPGESHVVYIDHDPVAAAHAYLLLEKSGRSDRHFAIQADLLDYERLWDAVLECGRIDPTRPVGLLLLAVLHFVPDDGPRTPSDAVAFLRDEAMPGSYLALSHGTYDGMTAEERARLSVVQDNYDNKSTARTRERGHDEILTYFGDWELVEPGLVWTSQWNPEGLEQEHIDGDLPPEQSRLLAGAARKPR